MKYTMNKKTGTMTYAKLALQSALIFAGIALVIFGVCMFGEMLTHEALHTAGSVVLAAFLAAPVAMMHFGFGYADSKKITRT